MFYPISRRFVWLSPALVEPLVGVVTTIFWSCCCRRSYHSEDNHWLGVREPEKVKDEQGYFIVKPSLPSPLNFYFLYLSPFRSLASSRFSVSIESVDLRMDSRVGVQGVTQRLSRIPDDRLGYVPEVPEGSLSRGRRPLRTSSSIFISLLYPPSTY